MKALVQTAPNTLVYREEPQPEPRAGEALVRVEAVGICGSDMHAIHGHDSRRPTPIILGHEAAGRVLDGPLAGQRVAVNPLWVPADCAFAREGRPHLSPRREILSMPPRPGAFAEWVRAPVENLCVIPEEMPAQHAALAEPIAVAYHAVHHGARLLGRPLPGARCLVLGGGAIGLACALVLRQAGAGEVWLIEPNPARRETALRAGITLARAPEDGPEDGSADLILDAVGHATTRAAASRIARPGGVIVHAGLLPGTDGLDVRRITLQEITLTGTYCYTPAEFRSVVALLIGGRFGALDWLEMRPLAEGAQAVADIDAGRVAAAKLVLIP
ncbi:alcohol dehydrogenase catalytic domain-containing protein [Roseococcus sp. SDR]|uniref:zinc-dependent alcohol dehydrogenase n=1 Tax=Roseococcus sp. SDR TaxID=2835532 RepID=UPI001BCFF4C8|nr:alcohol dehydrogenase catalytic domain-containing protein [Roseococcus sp. SDR]MBS7788607.1 alcohol dehydrogenase catalytic domain-containing protein [Roseococcus sp. SDR]MBV1843921.1 alcohol dehydrogenase catalytic domain-containing protein [Roseococcus sp. SDR]